MPSSIPRLRWLFATAAILLLGVVAGFYFYGRYRVSHLAGKSTIKALGVEIQQSTEGFSLSKSENGRNLYTIRAKNATQFKQGGRAELHDVNIVVYGRQGDRFDHIYGASFEYDPQSGDIISQGVVHIDLESAQQAGPQPEDSPPQQAKDPVHIETANLVFNQKTGQAETNGRVDFRNQQTSGSAMGASYDSKENMLTLTSEVHVHSEGTHPLDLAARHGVITKNPRQIVLDDALLDRENGTMQANQATIFLRSDNSVDHIIGVGEVQMTSINKGERFVVRAPQGQVNAEGKHNEITNALLSGGVTMEQTGAHPMNGQAGRVLLDFADAKLRKVHATDGAKLLQPPASPTSAPVRAPGAAGTNANAQTVELDAETIDLRLSGEQVLETADTSGPAQVVILSAGNSSSSRQTAPSRTVVTAGKFDATFANNRMQTVHGAPNARIVSSTPGQADRVSTSRQITADFDNAGAISKLVQQGDFVYHEPLPNHGERAAWAEKATYDPADQLLTLVGSPRMVEGSMTTTARAIRMWRGSGDAQADSDVKTTYSDLKAQPNGALLAGSDPIHVTARSMTARRDTGMARYTGDARLWQGPNIVQAPVIDFNRDQRSMAAQGSPQVPVRNILVQQPAKGQPSPVTVTSLRLTYMDLQRLAHYEGGVLVKSADGTMTSEQADVYLKPSAPGAPATASLPTDGSSQLDHMVAEGQVVVTQPARRANGQKLVYTADDGKYVLTGGPPLVWDAAKGTTTGDSLTFWNRDDRVLVEGGQNAPAVTKTRVSK